MSRATGEITGATGPSAGRRGSVATAPARVARLESPALEWLALGALLVVGAVMLWHLTRNTTLVFDELQWALYRRGNDLGTFLRPHNDHLSLVPIGLYRVLFATAGLNHYGPYRAMVIAAHLGVVTLVFVYARTRVGAWLAVLAAALVLFLGPAWQNILWPFQVGWLISIAAGLGALLALDRRVRHGDVAASVLLLVSLASSGIGVAFALGLAVDVLYGRRRVRDVWIVAAPLVPYAVWWVAYQQSVWVGAAHQRGIDHPLLHGILHAPAFVAKSAASAMAATTGLGGRPGLDPSGAGTLILWGRPLAIAAIAVVAWRLWTLRTLPPRVAALAVIVLSFWTFTSVTRGFISAPWTSRYLYVGGLLIVLLAVELARGARASPLATAILAVAAVAICVSNIGAYRYGAQYQRVQAQVTRAETTTLEITRPFVAPGFVANHLYDLRAGSYFSAQDANGSTAESSATLATQPDAVRLIADRTLTAINRIAPQPVRSAPQVGSRPTLESVTGGTVSGRGGCLEFRPAGLPAGATPSQMVVTLPRAGLLLTSRGAPATLAVRRFADEYQTLGALAPGRSATLSVQTDLASQAWHLSIVSTGDATVCGLG